MFPPRAIQFSNFKRPVRLLGAGEIFGPPPGPATAISTPDSCEAGPWSGDEGYGVMPFGDEGAVVQGVGGEDPAVVGFVIQLSEYNFTAQRTQTWGGSSVVSATFDNCRKFIEGACGQSCRQELQTLATGQRMFKFYNPAYEALQRSDPESGYGD